MNLKLLFYQKVIFPLEQARKRLKCEWWLLRTLVQKECYISPFFGEFGHLLGHYVPFLAFLHKKGVKIHYCGLEIHKPFFVDDSGSSIIADFYEIRDLYQEVKPMGNQLAEPADISEITSNFIRKAKKSKFCYWDLSDFDFYYSYFRWWSLNHKKYHSYDLEKVYGNSKKLNQVIVFPRKSTLKNGGKALFCNGQDWDYKRLITMLAKKDVEIKVIGHPSFSQDLDIDLPNVEFNFSGDNTDVLKLCAESKLIITQHSGASYLGAYLNTQVLMIYLGGNSVGEIEITESFNNKLNTMLKFDFAFDYEQVFEKVEEYILDKGRGREYKIRTRTIS